MRIRWLSCTSIFPALTAALLVACCAPLAAQAPDAPVKDAPVKDAPVNSAPVKEIATTGIGFSYQLPPSWAVIETRPSPAPAAPAASILPKKGTACISVPTTARSGAPASVIVVVELPFDCYGQAMTGPDLASLGSGVTDGLKQTFDIADPVQGTYTLGSHSLWIERAKGNPKGQVEVKPQTKSQAQAQVQYTVEIACSVLKKAAVCWMTTAADEASLHAFEAMPVVLDDDAAAPLVPSTAFDKAPPPP